MGAMSWLDDLRRKKLMDPLTAVLYLVPAGVVIVVFRMIPIASAFVLSFFDVKMGRIRGFVGLAQYTNLFQDPTFWSSLGTTAYYVIGVVPISLFLSLFIAVLLNQKIRGLGFYRTVYFLPVVTSLVAVSMVWKWIFHPRLGLLNYVFSWFGGGSLQWLEEPRGVFEMAASGLGWEWWPDALSGPSLALIAVIVVAIWRGIGYNIVIFLAGLQNIPDQYYEAARIDGASARQVFWKVTWPLLSPTTFYVLLSTTIVSFQVFTQIYLMTGPPVGGPMGTTKVIVYYLFEKGFDAGGNMGYASAVALVLFAIILSLTLIQRRVVERRVYY
jgi:multiple sugar transport system permease protein